MITIEFLAEQLHARPFVAFSIVLNSGDRFRVKTSDHADLPPLDDRGERSNWFIAYTERSIPRYLAIENIASLNLE